MESFSANPSHVKTLLNLAQAHSVLIYVLSHDTDRKERHNIRERGFRSHVFFMRVGEETDKHYAHL